MKNLKRFGTETEFTSVPKINPQISYIDDTKRVDINQEIEVPVNYTITVPQAFLNIDNSVKTTVTIDGTSKWVLRPEIAVVSTQKVSLKIEIVNSQHTVNRLADIECTPMIQEFTMMDDGTLVEITDWKPNQNLVITGILSKE